MRDRAPPRLQFRVAKASDLDRLVEIHLAAYPDPRSVDARQRNFTHSRFGKLSDLVVAIEHGAVVAHAFLFPFRAWFGGVAVKVGGIGSVGVAPESRGRGIATALMHELHRLSARRGDVLTMLYPFRQGFYARLGYAPTSSRKRLAIAPRSVPDAWRALARERVRGLRSGDDRLLRELHARAAERASGWLTRSRRHWEWLVLRETRFTLVCEPPATRTTRRPRATGYVAFTLFREEQYGETFLEVEEIVFDDDVTRRALVGALASMRDQVKEILIEVPEDDPLERALVDSDGGRAGTDAVEHGLGEIVGGPMVRIHEARRALTARGYSGNGAFDVVVRSPGPDGGAEAAFGVRVRDGRADVGSAAKRRGAVLTTTRSGLAAVLYGGLRASAAVALGLADAEPRVASAIDALVRIPPVAPIDPF